MVTTDAHRLSERDDEVAVGAMAYKVTRPIDMAKLTDELAAAVDGARPGLVAHGDPGTASEDDPVTLWVLGADMTTFKRTVRNHELPAPDVDDTRLLAFLRRKDPEEDFTPEEIQQALRLLLKRAGG